VLSCSFTVSSMKSVMLAFENPSNFLSKSFRLYIRYFILFYTKTSQKKIFCPANRAKRAGTNKWSGHLDSPQKNKDSNFSIYKQKIKKFMNAKLSRITLYTNFETHVLIYMCKKKFLGLGPFL
jgi:hypothetical protein